MFKKNGFTLTELLVVIFIIGILTAVVVVATTSARSKGNDAKRKTDIDTVAQALEIYYAQNKNYPVSTTYTALQSVLSPSFISSWPQDPKNSSPYVYNYYPTSSTTPNKKFVLDAKLQGSNETVVTTLTDCSVAGNQSNFYVSGVVSCGNDNNSLHYRRASQ